MKKLLFTLTALTLMASPSFADPVDELPSSVMTTPVQTPAVAAPANLQGTVSQTTVTGSAAPVTPTVTASLREILQFAQTMSAYNGKFDAVKFAITNTQNTHIQIINADVLNGVDEAYVAEQQARSKAAKRRAGGFLLRSLSAVPFASMGAYSSVGAYRAASIGSHVANTAANSLDEAANASSADYSGRYVRRVNDVVIGPNETFTFNTLVPKNDTAQVKLVLKNLQTNEIQTITK